MRIGVPKETLPDERNVALVPAVIPALTEAGLEVLVQAGAGSSAGFPDSAYAGKGANILEQRSDLFAQADVILQVRGLGANPQAGQADLELLRPDQIVVGFLEPLSEPEAMKELAGSGVTAFAMELIPRIARAQSMDALSSLATVGGYKAVLLAAGMLPKMFPMLMTAGGTVTPARALVVGAGVAGLQAIATARRLGAVVQAYDVRPAVKEQVESLGAKFLELPLPAEEAEAAGGYAKAMDEQFYRRQREMMREAVAESDVVITTAAVPGKKAPVLITAEMIGGMNPGAVIVDLAAERGGNCELTQPGQTVARHGVSILGPINLPSTVPYHASQLYARNISNLLLHLVAEGGIEIDLEDEITRETLVTRGGELVHPRVREILGMEVADSEERSDT